MKLPHLPTLARITSALRRQHGRPKVPPPRTAFEWVLWENVAYLASDDTRGDAFALLERSVGFGSALRSYAASYRSVKAAVPIAGISAKKLFEAYLLLRTHGQTICKAGAPLCSACQLRTMCAYALTRRPS